MKKFYAIRCKIDSSSSSSSILKGGAIFVDWEDFSLYLQQHLPIDQKRNDGNSESDSHAGGNNNREEESVVEYQEFNNLNDATSYLGWNITNHPGCEEEEEEEEEYNKNNGTKKRKREGEGGEPTSKEHLSQAAAAEVGMKGKLMNDPSEEKNDKRTQTTNKKTKIQKQSSPSSPSPSSKASQSLWDKRINLLKEYKQKNGHVNVPQNDGELGTFCNLVRKNYKWLRDESETNKTNYDEKNTTKPNNDEDDKDSKEEKKKRKKKKSMLTGEKIQQLLDIGFQFSTRKEGRVLSFDDRIGQLQTFLNDHPNLNSNNVPNKEPYQGLYRWILYQRESYKKKLQGKATTLTEERIQTLSQMGVDLRVSVDDKNWDEKYQALVVYKKEKGHTNVPRKHPELGDWVSNQRKRYKKLLQVTAQNNSSSNDPTTTVVLVESDERIRKLNEIGFEFSIRERRYYKKPTTTMPQPDDPGDNIINNNNDNNVNDVYQI